MHTNIGVQRSLWYAWACNAVVGCTSKNTPRISFVSSFARTLHLYHVAGHSVHDYLSVWLDGWMGVDLSENQPSSTSSMKIMTLWKAEHIGQIVTIWKGDQSLVSLLRAKACAYTCQHALILTFAGCRTPRERNGNVAMDCLLITWCMVVRCVSNSLHTPCYLQSTVDINVLLIYVFHLCLHTRIPSINLLYNVELIYIAS